MIQLIRKLWPELRAYKWRFIGLALMGIVVGLVKSLIAPLMSKFTEALQIGDRRVVILVPLLLAMAWILASVGRYFHTYITKVTADQIAASLRNRLMAKTLRLNLSYFQGTETGYGGLISRMINDVTEIQVGNYRLADLTREPFAAAFALGYLIYIDWTLTFFILLAVPVITTIMRNIARSLRKYAHHNQEAMEAVTKTLKESLDGLRIIQSFNLQDYIRQRFGGQLERHLDTRRKITSREEASGPINESLLAIFLTGLLIYIGFKILDGKLSMESFVGFMFAMGLLQDAVKKIQEGYVKLQQAGVALDRLHAVFDHVDVMNEPSTPRPFPSGFQEIEYRDVSFSFKDRKVLDGVSFKVRRGQMIALVGASGSGKSTAVNLLERFFDPDSGRILIDGVDIRDFSLRDLRAHVALVSQDVFLFGDSIETNILAGDFTKTTADIERAADLANADGFIGKTPRGYKSAVGDLGTMLSGGEKQRISIARAILKDAPILILDEATSALDTDNEREVQAGLNHLMSGRTTIVIAHRLSTIQQADTILVFRAGRIVERGSHAELLRAGGEYYRLQQAQQLGYSP
jgi:ATP-binding cassette subfamily B protein/subfamily B ATP-binding cassette protein MsbA